MDKAASSVWLGTLRRSAAVTQLALLLLLGFSAVSPELHGWIHSLGSSRDTTNTHSACPHHAHHDESVPDSDEGCAVDLFAQGKVLMVSEVVTVGLPARSFELILPGGESVHGSCLGQLPPTCGPPLSVV